MINDHRISRFYDDVLIIVAIKNDIGIFRRVQACIGGIHPINAFNAAVDRLKVFPLTDKLDKLWPAP